MERQIGDQFDFGGVTLEVVESGQCKGCYFFKTGYHIYCEEHDSDITGDCGPFNRVDCKSVIFKEVKE